MHILFPPRCPFCDKVLFHSLLVPREFVCNCCKNKPEYIKEPVCYKCGKPIVDKKQEYCYDCEKKRKEYIQGKALWIYKDDVRESLYRFKYCNRQEYATYYGLELVSVYGEWMKKCGIEAIIPIPLSKKRMRQRGFNQAALVADEIGKRMKIPVYHNLLIRVLDTKAQKELNEEERKNNLKRAFKTSVNKVQLDHILLIDDIYTTGSTMNEATKTLKQAGVDQIYCLSISIGRGY